MLLLLQLLLLLCLASAQSSLIPVINQERATPLKPHAARLLHANLLRVQNNNGRPWTASSRHPSQRRRNLENYYYDGNADDGFYYSHGDDRTNTDDNSSSSSSSRRTGTSIFMILFLTVIGVAVLILSIFAPVCYPLSPWDLVSVYCHWEECHTTGEGSDYVNVCDGVVVL